MSQAAGCNEPSAGEMPWQVLMDPGVLLKGGFCGGEQGVIYFLLLWPFWNILSSLAGMVSVDQKKMVTVSLEETLAKYLKSYICFFVKCLKYEA